MTEYLETQAGRRIAYDRSEGRGPWIVFLGGFMSDRAGTKAVHLEAWATGEGRAFLRFDYSGHGESSGTFEEGSIGDWADDAIAAIEALTNGPVVLVGSSMGGWISLLVAARLSRVAGFVGIAAAPDFTENHIWAGFGEGERARLMDEGRVMMPSPYGPPYPITRRLIEDGRDRLVMDRPAPEMGCVRLLQGTADEEVEIDVALHLLAHLDGDVRLTLVKGADHRFSSPECLSLIEAAVREVADAGEGPVNA